ESVVVVDVNDKVNMKLANTIRLGVKQVRLDAEKTFDAKRAEVQQQMLSYKTEDSLWLKSKQTMQILTKEIEENARWKEETKERFDKEQKELITQQRILEVSKYAETEINRINFEFMADETFNIFLGGLKSTFEAKIEAAKQLEIKRLKEIEDEKIRVENQRLAIEKLKAEAETKEKQLAEERAKAEAERKANELKAAKLKAESDAKLKAEKEAKSRLEQELKSKKDNEEKAKKVAELKLIAEQKEAAKLAKSPIKKQLATWVDSFSLGKPISDNETTALIENRFESFKQWAKSEIEKL
ncbi:MAG: hypothetical protein NUV57_01610, partial [archaeon]|nr:hypothetical protein [archaeon]